MLLCEDFSMILVWLILNVRVPVCDLGSAVHDIGLRQRNSVGHRSSRTQAISTRANQLNQIDPSNPLIKPITQSTDLANLENVDSVVQHFSVETFPNHGKIAFLLKQILMNPNERFLMKILLDVWTLRGAGLF